MKLLFVTYRDTHGSGNYTISCVKKFMLSGYTVKMLVAEKKTNNDFIIQYKFSRLHYYFNKLLKRVELLFNLYISDYEFHDRGRYLIPNIKKFHNSLEKFNPDIIVINWISELVSIDTIYSYSKSKNIELWIWPIDKSLFFGGCHFNLNCKLYLSSCSNCPAVPFYKRNDVNKKYISNQKILRESTLIFFNLWFKKYVLEILSIDNLKYHFYYDESQFNSINILTKSSISNEVHLVYGSSQIDNIRKGFNEFVKIIKNIDYKLKSISIKVFLHFVGNNPVDLKLQNIHQINHGYLNLDEMKYLLLSTDIVVSTSLDDIGPSFLVSAIECGNIPFAFSVGIAQDLIKDGTSGFLFNLGDVTKFEDVLFDNILNKNRLEYLKSESTKSLKTYLEKLFYLKTIP